MNAHKLLDFYQHFSKNNSYIGKIFQKRKLIRDFKYSNIHRIKFEKKKHSQRIWRYETSSYGTSLACVRIYWKDNNYYRQFQTTIQLYQHNGLVQECCKMLFLFLNECNLNICSCINKTKWKKNAPCDLQKKHKIFI